MKIKKAVVYSLLTLQLMSTFAPTKVAAQSIHYDTIEIQSSITPKVDDIRWQYKAIDGLLYKRLYNYSTKTPLSDWQLVT